MKKNKKDLNQTTKMDAEEIKVDNKDEQDIKDGTNNNENLEEELKKQTEIAKENFELAQRIKAEFDNYKKRTTKEKISVYTDSVCDTVGEFLPVLDNLERAIKAAETDNNIDSLKKGIELVLKQYKEVIKNIGVEEISGEGKVFDPNLHNAVMHVEDENAKENTIIEEFQKGYIYKEKVIRHSMVKVAN